MERGHDPARLNGALPQDTEGFCEHLNAAANHLSEPSPGFTRSEPSDVRQHIVIFADGTQEVMHHVLREKKEIDSGQLST